ncbi:MAG: hypothetical protein JXJ04_01280 [Spirochaetales bacterium]|nr:hypothetical protein [Spirochaetales bacterium]
MTKEKDASDQNTAKKRLSKSEHRLKVIKAIINNNDTNKKLEDTFKMTKGKWADTITELKKDESVFKEVQFTHSLAVITQDNEELAIKLAADTTQRNLRELAFKHTSETLKTFINPDNIPASIPGNTPAEKQNNYAEHIKNHLYYRESSPVIRRMIDANELPVKDTNIRQGVLTFLNNKPDFNFRLNPVYPAIKQKDAFKGIEKEHHSGVIDLLKKIQRLQICPRPEAIPVLINHNLTSSYHITEIPEKVFIKRMGKEKEVGEAVAKQIYANAVMNRLRIENALMGIREAVTGTGVQFIDGKKTPKDRMEIMQSQYDEQFRMINYGVDADGEEEQVQLNWETLFGSVDLCECDECNSVYSPAAYFVELLQFLRNNNLDPDADGDQAIKDDPKDITGTALEMLFRRRPDLGCLELTCKNANIVLPYIDLVNEVMESFVVHINEYKQNSNDPKQAIIEAFNITDDIMDQTDAHALSGELMAQPQNINYKAYCLLKQAVYPFTLPYHQPLDAQRIFLKFLNSSRYELMKCFKTGLSLPAGDEEIPGESCVGEDAAPESDAAHVLTEDKIIELAGLHEEAISRALDAEYLGIFQAEYIILSKQAYWKKRYFDLKCNKTFTEEEYNQKIGLVPVYKYYGYDNEAAMLDSNEDMRNGHIGLTFVKDQFLKRTGVLYTDLVDLLRTQFINPNYPKGKALTIFENLRFSYRFMQSLVNYNSSDKAVRYGKLIEFLKKAQPLIPYIDELLHPDPCKVKEKLDPCAEIKDLEKWVYCCFEKVGKVIVLESIGSLQIIKPEDYNLVGYLRKDNQIFDPTGKNIAYISSSGKVYNKITGLADFKGGAFFLIRNDDNNNMGYIKQSQLFDTQYQQISYIQTSESYDLKKIRLKHLDNSDLTSEEYDRILRFIRLWRKMGWSIDEVDKAITGLAGKVSDEADEELPGEEDCFPTFDEDCECTDDTSDSGCHAASTKKSIYDITPEFLRQLAAIKMLLEKTGLELIKLLTFWTDISTQGEKSLYRRLFLTHNLKSLDKVFEADKNGNYLAKPAFIKDHKTVLMAAFNLKAEELEEIMRFKNLSESSLTLGNISTIYRCNLLLKLIHVKAINLEAIFDIFGEIFKSANETLEFFKLWEKMENAGFDIRLLNFILNDKDDEKKPLMPDKKAMLQLVKTLFDGLSAIKNDHPDVVEEREATSELLQSKLSLIYSRELIEKIAGLLEGTTVYPAKAPDKLVNSVEEFEEKISSEAGLKRKLKYDFINGAIQVTGILTDSETAAAKALFAHADWSKALDKITKKVSTFYAQFISHIMPKPAPGEEDNARKILLKGDVIIPGDEQNPANTALEKRAYFLAQFLPYLRNTIKKRFIVDTFSTQLGLEREVTDVLISDILFDDASDKSLLEIFGSVMDRPPENPSLWKGYLFPAAEGDYAFIIKKDVGPEFFKLDGVELKDQFTKNDDEDFDIYWLSALIPLKAGKPYQLEIKGLSPNLSELFWKTATTEESSIPSSFIIPDLSDGDIEKAYKKLLKISLLGNGFKLKADEIIYLQKHKDDFDQVDFNAYEFKFVWWKRLLDFTLLRNSLPATDTNLIEFFTWAGKAQDTWAGNEQDISGLIDKISKLTNWEKETIEKLIPPTHFNINTPSDFTNEKSLLKLQKAIYIAGKINIDINLLFEWAKPESGFRKCLEVAENIKNTIKARYKQTDWEQVVKPLNDRLRTNQRNALIDYLLVQQPLIEWGVIDADSLFEFFLIDVQMEAVMETSRLKQAISSVQLFVQRCLLGLEADKGVPNDVLDRDRWEWMQRHRVWEANRKVFLYPENWIESELRDDKSPFFKELESELLQKDLNSENVKDALKTYLYKVDEVANMQVVGLFVEREGECGNEHNRIHVFSRTRNAPYFFYYRYYEYERDKEDNITGGDWYPWEKVQVDIPSYDVEDSKGKITGNGCYLIPVVWNNRRLIFFPQFMKKTEPVSNTINTKQENDTITVEKPSEIWEIKMAWSEYRNGKWTQKQISKDAVYTESLGKVNKYFFVQIVKEFEHISIIVYESIWMKINKQDKKYAGEFVFRNNYLSVKSDQQIYKTEDDIDTSDIPDDFHYRKFSPNVMGIIPPSIDIGIPKSMLSIQDSKILVKIFQNPEEKNLIPFDNIQNIEEFKKLPDKDKKVISQLRNLNFFLLNSLQSKGSETDYLIRESEYSENTNIIDIQNDKNITFRFYHPFIAILMNKVNNSKLDKLFSYNLNIENFPDEPFGQINNSPYNELRTPYAIYNWELFFHTPALIADKLSKSQQYEEAMKWFHYVFNPHAEGTDAKRFWQFYPFKETDAEDYLEKLFYSLKPNEPDTENPVSDGQINEWRDKPFMPHVIARKRPSAYMKWVVMKYLDNLIDWADSLFRQYTIETINQATQLYILASHILGPKPQIIPRRGKIKPRTYMSLLDKWDASGNAMVEMEVIALYSNQIPVPVGKDNNVIGFANIFGFSSSLYFCIPNNPKLLNYWSIIEDRLFKIRHCQTIEGVFSIPALWDPPIDPALLVQAAAQGVSISSVLNDLNAPMPNYRFNYLIQKALELCNELKSMGNALLSALEKKDAEALSVMRTRHECTMNNLVMEIKKLQLDEANQALEGLKQNRKSPEYRLKHYIKLIGEDTNKVPGEDADFTELPNQLETPVDESGLKLINLEKQELDKAKEAANYNLAAGICEALAGILHVIPNFSMDVKLWGVGGGFVFGGTSLAGSVQAVGKGLQLKSGYSSFESSHAARKAGYLRQLQDRVFQANLAGYEIKQIDKQIASQNIRMQLANKEINNQQAMIDNAKEVEEFLKTKYTNEQLYSWMIKSIKTLYRQVYTIAFDLAKKAEKAFCFERGLSTSNFIQFGYWDAARDGLHAGERLYLGIKQLEAAYQEKRGYDYEITKHVSLRQINPLALFELRENGICEFALPEVLFDMDFPGHYMRRIKSAALSIPCVVGPYTSVNCTLRLLGHKYRIDPLVGRGYSEKTAEVDDRFSTLNIPITSIAVSSGQNDSGVFELNFRDERYMPFEGAGVISKWRIELPQEFKQFDYNTITDVILHLRYTSLEGGEKLKTVANKSLLVYLKSAEELSRDEGLFALFDLKNDFPSEWVKLNQSSQTEAARPFTLDKLNEYFPVFTKNFQQENKMNASEIMILTSTETNDNMPAWVDDGQNTDFTPGIAIGGLRSFTFDVGGIAIDKWQIRIPGEWKTESEQMWMVVKYTLGKGLA